MLAGLHLRRLGRIGLLLCVGGALAVLVASGCDDSPASPDGQPNLRLLLTDDITDDVEQVNLFFTSVTAKPAGEPVERLGLMLTENPVDLLSLSDRVTMLAAGVVEPGRYEFIHVNIDERRSSLVEDGVQKPLRIPSGEVKILGGFEVDDDHQTTITLDFNAADSLIRLGNGNWLLRPIIVITHTTFIPQS